MSNFFGVMRICSRRRVWPACVKFHAADDMQFQVLLFAGSITVCLYRIKLTQRNETHSIKLTII
jgi:hypothetical protein